MKERNHQ